MWFQCSFLILLTEKITLDEYWVKPKVELFPIKWEVLMYALHDDDDKPRKLQGSYISLNCEM